MSRSMESESSPRQSGSTPTKSTLSSQDRANMHRGRPVDRDRSSSLGPGPDRKRDKEDDGNTSKQSIIQSLKAWIPPALGGGTPRREDHSVSHPSSSI